MRFKEAPINDKGSIKGAFKTQLRSDLSSPVTELATLGGPLCSLESLMHKAEQEH